LIINETVQHTDVVVYGGAAGVAAAAARKE
jgi:hypothetical protein